MSKRNLASATTPDVRYETDENGTKLIIRKFDFPLPPKTSVNSSVSQTLLFSNPRERWKYQHDVPEGKIYTKRIHDLNPITSASSKSNQNVHTLSSSSTECSSVSKVIPTTVQNQLSTSKQPGPGSKELKLRAPNDQSAKLVSPVLNLQTIDQTSNQNFLCGEKIKLNNLPNNVISNSMQVIDTKIVNGKKVVYLKALKEYGKPKEKSANKTLLSQTPSQNKVEQSKDEVQIVNTGFQSGISSCSNDKKCDKVQCVAPVQRTLQSVPNAQFLDNSSVPINKISSVLPQKTNQIGKTTGSVTGSSDCTVKKSDLHVNKSLPIVTPIIVPHSSVQVSPISVLPQTTYGLKSINTVLSAPTMSTFSTIPLNGITSCREIILPMKANSKLNSNILSKDPFMNNNLTSKNSKNQVVSDTSDYTTSASNSVFPIDVQKKVQKGELKLVPADSTTSFFADSSTVTSVNSTTDNMIPNDAIIVLGQENTTTPKDVTSVNLKESSICSTETKNSSCNESNIVIFNKTPSNLNLTGSNMTMISKQNINYNEMIRRRKIALQYQQDMQKSKVTPRMERTVELPARTVKVADISTQTTLFCLLEPGRMVEMYLNKEFVDMRTSNLNKNAETCANSELMNRNNTNKVTSDIINHHLNSVNHNSENSENMDAPLSKRIRLDKDTLNLEILKDRSGTHQNTGNDCYVLQASLVSQDYIQPQVSKNLNRKNRTDDTSSSDIDKLYANKNMMKQLFMDYRDSLKPDEDSNLPIHNAVMDNDYMKVERQCLVLLGQRQTVNVKNIRNETPLHLAVLCQNLKMVSLLLKYKARINISDSVGNTALHNAIIWGNNIEILKLLLATVDERSSVLNDANDEGYSPLHLCVLHNKAEEAFILMKKGADVNIRDRKSGRTPLFHAEEAGNKDLSRMLVNAGASTSISNFCGQTPLHASELSYIKDNVRTKPEILKSSNNLIVPCSCVSNNSVDEDILSEDENNSKFNENAEIIDLIASDSGDALDLYETIFHNR